MHNETTIQRHHLAGSYGSFSRVQRPHNRIQPTNPGHAWHPSYCSRVLFHQVRHADRWRYPASDSLSSHRISICRHGLSDTSAV